MAGWPRHMIRPRRDGRTTERLEVLRRGKVLTRAAMTILSLALLAGCEAAQVANRTISQSSYIPDIQYKQVIDNLAIIADNPSALPYFNPPNLSRTTIQRTAGTTFGMQWGIVSPFSLLKMFGAGKLECGSDKGALNRWL